MLDALIIVLDIMSFPDKSNCVDLYINLIERIVKLQNGEGFGILRC